MSVRPINFEICLYSHELLIHFNMRVCRDLLSMYVCMYVCMYGRRRLYGEKAFISSSLLPDPIEFRVYCICCYFKNKILFKLMYVYTFFTFGFS